MSSFRPIAGAGPSAGAVTGDVITSYTPAFPRKAFTPALFGKFGSKASDLFKKKFDYDHTLKVVNKTADGNEITTSVVQADKGLRGVFSSKLPVRSLGALNGTFESEFHTVTNKQSKTSYSLTNLFKGGLVKASLVGVKDTTGSADFPEGFAQVEAEYKQEYVNSSVGVRTNGAKTLVDAVLAVGYDNLSVGGKVTVNANDKKAPEDYNFGAEYQGVDYVAAATTDKKHTLLNLSYFQQLNRNHLVGAIASFGLTKPSRTLQFGTHYAVDPDTEVRGFAKIESGKDVTVLATHVQHQLAQVRAQLGVSAEFNVGPSQITPGKFGVTISLGDY